MERPSTHLLETAEDTAALYLSNLGLEWSDLQGKKIVDIGALNAAFENAGRRRGIDITSLDMEVAEGEYMPPTDSRFVVANATKLPFRDEAFDYAVAHMSVTNYLEKGYKEEDYLSYIEDVLREVFRVLRPEGQFRFMDTATDDDDLRKDETDVIPDRTSDEYSRWRIEREHQMLENMATRIGYRELRVEKYPDSHPAKDEHVLSHYYIAYK